MKKYVVAGVIGVLAVGIVARRYTPVVPQMQPVVIAPVSGTVEGAETQTGVVLEENPVPQLPLKPLVTITPSAPIEMVADPEATVYKMGEGTVLHWTMRAENGFTAGTIAVRHGAVQVRDGSVIAGGFIIDTTSLQTLDPAASGFLTQLVGPNFLDVDAHPTASFILQEADGGTIRGVFTLKGTSKSLSIPAVVIVEDDGIVLTADVAVSRTQRAGTGGQDTLGEYIEIAFTVPFAP